MHLDYSVYNNVIESFTPDTNTTVSESGHDTPSYKLIKQHYFKEISKNCYSKSVKMKIQYEMEACDCEPESSCATSCINRSISYECMPKNCPGGDMCKNIQIQNHIALPLETFLTEVKGIGVKTNGTVNLVLRK